MKAKEIRNLATLYSLRQLEDAAEALAEREEETLQVEGDSPGERLTHLMLAARVRARIESGLDPKAAFREVMGDVRQVLENE